MKEHLGKILFVIMVAVSWVACCVAALILNEPEIMKHAYDFSVIAGVGYFLAHY